ncbi:hypothetical protein HMN09_00447100 [Mycena chlorophos]|uniref:Uncharacterized protein n=1 Tax=Mycena chlorophos TaxID=658473 RepID=A0A8H6WLU0_MYCCL|nr:hypothetical protein HMN09_00447100 [Mycena chlorophos]
MLSLPHRSYRCCLLREFRGRVHLTEPANSPQTTTASSEHLHLHKPAAATMFPAADPGIPQALHCIDTWAAQLADSSFILPPIQQQDLDDGMSALATQPNIKLEARKAVGRVHLKLAVCAKLFDVLPQPYQTRAVVKTITAHMLRDCIVDTLSIRITPYATRSPHPTLLLLLTDAIYRLRNNDRAPVQLLVNTLFGDLFQMLEDLSRSLFNDHAAKILLAPAARKSSHVFDCSWADATVRMILARLRSTVTSNETLEALQSTTITTNRKPRKRSRAKARSHASAARGKKTAACTCHEHLDIRRQIASGKIPDDSLFTVKNFNLTAALQNILRHQFCPVHPIKLDSTFRAPSIPTRCWHTLHLDEPAFWETPLLLGRLLLEFGATELANDVCLDHRHWPVTPQSLVAALTTDVTIHELLVKAGVCNQVSEPRVPPSVSAKAFCIYVGAVFWSGALEFAGISEWWKGLLAPVVGEVLEVRELVNKVHWNTISQCALHDDDD